jgi:hypothetical protein
VTVVAAMAVARLDATSLCRGALAFAAGAFAAFAWGIWQTWFVCAGGLVPLYLRIATAIVEEPKA